MSEPSLAAQATMHELEQRALARARETGVAVATAMFVASDQAVVCDLNPATGEAEHETTVTLPDVRRLYP